MQIDKRTIQIGLVLVTTLISLSSLFAQPAQAIMRDQAVVGRLQDQREVLLKKERVLLEDYDDLQRQIREIQKADPRLVDQLCRQADVKYDDLQSVRQNLRQVESMLI
jgi:hypothetical protein